MERPKSVAARVHGRPRDKRSDGGRADQTAGPAPNSPCEPSPPRPNTNTTQVLWLGWGWGWMPAASPVRTLPYRVKTRPCLRTNLRAAHAGATRRAPSREV